VAAQATGKFETVRQDAVRETSAALFAEATLNLTRWLRATGGLRYDHYWFDVRGPDRRGGPSPGP